MKKLALFVLIVIVVLMTGCASPTTKQPAEIESAEPPTSAEVAEPQTSVAAAETSELTPIAEQIVHSNIPENAVFTRQTYEECNTSYSYNNSTVKITSPCDNWDTNLIERPVSADLKTFYGYLDILSSRFGTDSQWFFGSIEVNEASIPDDGVDMTYFLELDVDQDGRGDYLVAVTNLGLDATDWTVEGVRVWEDSDGDVGGLTAVRPDTSTGNGYETLLFDSGRSDDPDLAWARRLPDTPNQIQFAFKTGMLEGVDSLMWWAGALRGSFDAGQFDLVDSQTADALFEYDNTCGWVFGWEKGYNFKKCYVPIPPTATPDNSCTKPPAPSTDTCWQFIYNQWGYRCEWVCFN
jgi:hypothetical protein